MTDNASSTVKLTRRIEFWLLLALILFVPLLEAPKNVVWLCYLLLWLFNRVGQRKKGEGWDLWDGLIAIWVLSGFIGGAFAGLHFNEWREPLDVVRYGLLLWAVKRSGYTQTDLRRRSDNWPVDADRGIVPADATLVLRVPIVRGFIQKICRIGEH